MAITYSFLAFAVTAGAAYFDNATYGPGPGLETLRDRPSSSESIVNNIRQSANFDLVYQGGYNVSRWSMSVDVTEYNTSQQVVNTIYALGFPSYDASNATLSEALPNERGQNDVNFDSSTALCATIVHNLLPANITNTLLSPNEDDNSTILANAQCSNVLGLPCMNAIIKAFVEHETDNVCKGTDLDLSDIDECKDAFSDEEFKSCKLSLINLPISFREDTLSTETLTCLKQLQSTSIPPVSSSLTASEAETHFGTRRLRARM